MKAFTTGPFTGRHIAMILVAFFAVVIAVNVLMARYAIAGRLKQPEQLRAFATEGYAYAGEASDEQRWVFRRRQK